VPEPGFWEREGRSPVLGSLIATTLIVALYSLAGNIVMLAYMLGDMRGFGSGDWIELRHGILDRYRSPILVLTMLFEFLFFGLGTFLLFRRWHGGSLRERFRIRLPAPAALPIAVVGAVGLFPLAMFAGDIFSRAFPFLRDLEQSSGALVRAESPGTWILLAAAICVTPALFEEFLFRGYLQGTLSRGMKSPWSWILTGGFFALVHQNYFGFGALLIIGIYLAYVFDAGGSIWPGSLVHFLYNGAIVVLANLDDHALMPWAFDPRGLVRLPVVAAFLPLGIVGVWSLAAIKRKLLAAALSGAQAGP
jgi:membrane protease YdiL (CAAX protease family)